MDFSSLYFITTILVLALEHRASSAPSSTPGPGPEHGGPLAQQVHRAHWREKRCSCENLKDKECVYFCHIGIVWVTTPGQVVPYGVGSFPARLRRELPGPGRCYCRDRHDTKCFSFCSPNGRMEDTDMLILRKLPTKFKKRYKERTLNAHLQLT